MAMLVISVVLSMGASIYSLVSKQVTLTGMTRDSRYAFYAADISAECALYWDIRHNYFATTTPAMTLTCNGVQPVFTAPPALPANGPCPAIPATAAAPLTGATYPYAVQFHYDYGSATSTSCAEVTVYKCLVNSTPNTIIHADGYSVSCGSRNTSVRSLQRSEEVQY